MPSGISLGIAAIQVLNKSILGFLSPLQKQFLTNKTTGKSPSYFLFHVKTSELSKNLVVN